MKKLLAIINPKSGTGNKAGMADIIARTIDPAKFQVDYCTVQVPGDAQRFAQKAIEGYYDGVLAVGGDGTVNGVASTLIGTHVAMGVVPCGSGNGLARHLNVPMNVEQALQVVNRDQVKDFDYCTVNGMPFVCTAGLGFDAQVAYAFALDGKRGFITYLKKTLEQYTQYSPEEYEIEIDGNKFTQKAFVIAFGNAAQYGNNSFIAPHASMQDGLIDVTVISPFPIVAAPIIGLSLFTKMIDKLYHVHVYRGKHVCVTRKAEGPMHIDGDPFTMPARLDIKCHPAGIKIFTPEKGENCLPQEQL